MLAGALMLCALPAAAQVNHDAAVWVNVTAIGSVKERLLYFAEVQPRATNDATQVSTVILRGALGWQVSDKLAVYQGYAHVEEPHANAGRGRNEERGFQQISWTLRRAGGVDMSSRTRFEQRWRSDASGMSLRVREMLRYQQALGSAKGDPAFLAWTEAFVGVKGADWAPEGFDQLRTFLGVVVPVKGRSTLEVGYVNQLRDGPGRSLNAAHAASLTLWVRP